MTDPSISPPTTGFSARRYALFLVVALGATFGLLLVPPPISSVIFYVGSAVLIGVPLWRNRHLRQELLFAKQKALMIISDPKMERTTQISFGAVVLSIGGATVLFHPDQYYSVALLGWLLFFLCLPTLGFVLWQHDKRASEKNVADLTAPPRPAGHRVQWHVVLIGCIPLAIVMQSNLDGSRYSAAFSHYGQMPLFWLGIIIATWGLCGYRLSLLLPRLKPLLPIINSFFSIFRHKLKTHVPLLLILGVAVAVRGWNLEYTIHRMIDEVHSMDAVGRMWYSDYKPILLPYGGVTAFTWMYPYLQGFTTALFGPGLTALRIVSVIFGTAQVAVIYGLMNTLFNRRTAQVAALILATLPVHVHFSRIGINNIADPLFGMLTFWFLARGMKHGNAIDFVFAGLSLGLTHYFYEGGRLFYPPFVVCWLGWLRLFGHKTDWRFPTAYQLGLFITASLLFIVPMYYTWGANAFPLMPRLEAAGGSFERAVIFLAKGIPTPATLWQQFESPLMMFTFSPEKGSFFSGNRLVPLLLVPFFLLGLGKCLWSLRSLGGSLFFWWFIGGALALSLLPGSPQSPRIVFMFPVIAAFVSIGLVHSWVLLRDYWLPSAAAAARAKQPHRFARVPLLIVGLLAAYQAVQYFALDLPNHYYLHFYLEREYGIPVKDSDDMLFRVALLPRNIDVYVVGQAVRGDGGFFPFLQYYGRVPDTRVIPSVRSDFAEIFNIRYLERRHHAFFVEEDDRATLDFIRERFPNLEGPYWSPFNVAREKQYALYLALEES